MMTYLEDEEGVDRVEELLRTERTLLPFIVALEVHYISTQERGPRVAQERLARLKALPCVWLDTVDEATLHAASRVKAVHRLSLADAVVAGFAMAQGATLVHKDPESEPLLGELPQERLPYKTRPAGP